MSLQSCGAMCHHPHNCHCCHGKAWCCGLARCCEAAWTGCVHTVACTRIHLSHITWRCRCRCLSKHYCLRVLVWCICCGWCVFAASWHWQHMYGTINSWAMYKLVLASRDAADRCNVPAAGTPCQNTTIVWGGVVLMYVSRR